MSVNPLTLTPFGFYNNKGARGGGVEGEVAAWNLPTHNLEHCSADTATYGVMSRAPKSSRVATLRFLQYTITLLVLP